MPVPASRFCRKPQTLEKEVYCEREREGEGVTENQHCRNHLTARLTVNAFSPCGAGSVDRGPWLVLRVAAAQRSVGMHCRFGVRQVWVCALALPRGCRPSGFRETGGQDPEPGLCLAAQECCHPSGEGLGSPQGGRGAVRVEGSFRPPEAVASP